jgi:uncharacterized protein YndB with AHSA1/START domain
MPVTQLGNDATTVYTDGAEMVMERIFDAPRALVWKALTEAERIPRWWGADRMPMTVEEMDVRVGGKWRWVGHHSEHGDVPFSGEYLEVVPPERLVNTEMYDVEPFNQGEPAIVTQTLEDLGGRTRLISRSVMPSVEALEGALATGMVAGAIESWDRMAEEIARIKG